VAGAFLQNFIRFVLLAVEVLVLARVVVSFVDPQGRNTISAYIIQTSEPILGPIRRLLPRTGMFDLSPLIVLVVIGAILQALG